MRICALVLGLSAALACNDVVGRDDASASTISVTTVANTLPPGTIGEPTTTQFTTGEATAVTTGDPATAAATTSGPDTGDPATGASTGPGTSIGTTFTTGDSAEVTGFETDGFDCDKALKATIRDFRVDHPDFQDYTGDAAFTGLVQATLGPDQNPVYANAGGTAQTTGPNEFAQWYSDVVNVNIPFMIDLLLTEVQPGLYSYKNNAFFPIDGQGWDNEGNPHNFHFTTEIHTSFVYKGGELFTFTGDDDLWLFINGTLAIDLGGTHPELTDTVDLDARAAALGITVGNTYPMDIFHAERHTSQSNFRIDTSIDCFIIPM